MGSHAPEMPILVDDETGVWTTDALPMLYVPRHFFVNNHMGIEDEIGAERYAEILYKAGYKSAYFWCEQESECHGIYGEEIWHHYLKRLSQRGWGFFITEELDIEKGTAKVRLENSAFVYHYEKIHGKKVNRKVDYMFTGWFAGALDQILESKGLATRTKAIQTQSAAEEGCDVGYFQVSPL